MSMIKRTTLTINKNNTGVKLSSPLNFYKHDNLTLYFEVERYNFELHQYARVVPLSAIAYVETPDGIDSIQATIVEDNLIMFYLTSYHTCNLGKSKLQLVVRDNDGCQCATPPFEFTVYDIINHDTIFTLEDGSIVVTEDDIPLTLEGNNGYNSISSLEEVSSLEDSYILISQQQKSYKASTSLLTGDIGEMLGYAKIDDIPISTSQLINDSGFLTEHQDISHLATKNEIPNINGLATETYVDDAIANAQLGGGGGDVDIDLSDYATKAELSGKADKEHAHEEYLTEHQNISHLATKEELVHNHDNQYAPYTHAHNQYLTEHQNLDHLAPKEHQHSYNELSDKPTIPSITGLATETYVNQAIANAQLGGGEGTDIDLTQYALKTDVPTKTSQLTNDSNYLTSIPSEYVTETELSGKGYLTQHQDLSDYAKKTDLFSGSYNDLTNKPTIPTVDVNKEYVDNQLTKKADEEHTHDEYLTSHQDISHLATKQELVHNHDNDYSPIGHKHTEYLTEHQSLDHLALKTEIPSLNGYATESFVTSQGYIKSIPSEYITETELNSKGYLTEHQDLTDYAKKTDIPSLNGYATEQYVTTAISNAQLGGGEEVDLSGYALKTDLPTHTSDLTNDSGFITEVPSEYVTESEMNAKGYLTEHQNISHLALKTDIPTVPTNVSAFTNDKGYLTSVPSEYVTETELNSKGYLTSHQDISHLALKSEIPSVPTKTSQLTNDSGFLTEHQDLSDYAKTSDLHSHSNKTVLDNITSTKVSEWDNKSNFSGSYDDLTNKPTIPSAYTHPSSHPATMITGLSTVATSGSYNDLSNKPTIPTIPSALPASGGNADTVNNYSVWVGTQAQYDAIGTKSNTTIYFIIG